MKWGGGAGWEVLTFMCILCVSKAFSNLPLQSLPVSQEGQEQVLSLFNMGWTLNL